MRKEQDVLTMDKPVDVKPSSEGIETQVIKYVAVIHTYVKIYCYK